MAPQHSSTSFRIFTVVGGHAFLVKGARGLLRSGLPRSNKGQVRRSIRSEYPDAREDEGLLPGLVDTLQRFYKGEKVRFRVKLDDSSLPPFTARVYRCLRSVGFGRTVTYQELAVMAGSPKAARGVGSAMRRNPFPPIVP